MPERHTTVRRADVFDFPAQFQDEAVSIRPGARVRRVIGLRKGVWQHPDELVWPAALRTPVKRAPLWGTLDRLIVVLLVLGGAAMGAVLLGIYRLAMGAWR